MEIKDIKAVYFVGAGGIGMSAIARYFIHKGIVVAGYDKTPSELTHQLEREGMILHYKESVEDIPHACRKPESCLVIYTPAIPADHKELVYFRENGFTIEKRAQVLGTLTRTHKGLCVAGTHGKTSTSTDNGEITFDFVSQIENVKDVELGQPAPTFTVSIENIKPAVNATAKTFFN